MSKVPVAIHGTPLRKAWIDPEATNGAIVGVNLWIEDPAGSGEFRLFDPTTDVVTTNVDASVLQTAPSGFDLDTDSVPEGVTNLYFTDARAIAAVASSLVGLLDFKGATNCSTNPNYPAALKGDTYIVSVAGKIGGASGTSVDAGDWYVAIADNAGGTEASVGASWGHIEHNLTGSAGGYYGVATGTNTYAATMSPVVSAYSTGQVYVVKFTNANSGVSTLDLGPGAKTVQLAGSALISGNIPANSTLWLIYDGTNLQIISGAGPSKMRFNVNLFDGSISTKYDATQKRVVGQLYFDPSNAAWGLTPSSTATLYVMLSTTNNANAAGADLYRETGTGAPTTVATLPTTTSLTQALLSVSVSTAFNSTSNAGIFDMRVWITTNNGNDQATVTAAWVEITP